MVDASGFAETWLCFAFTAFELLILFYGWRIKKVTWEQLWILFIECFSYGCAAAIPDAPFRNLELANGRTLPWMRFMGWLLTCPVLLMGLVSLGTVAGKASTVRMVPILVANMTMILLGITAAGIEEPGPQRIVYALAVGAGGVVFMTAGQVFYNMHSYISSLHFTDEDDMAAITKARRLCDISAACFFTGWLLFPIGFSLGPNFGQTISERGEMVFFFFGDILAKNTYVGLMVIFKHYFIPLAEGGTADAEIAATAGAEASRMAMRRPSQMITHEMIGMAQEMSPPRSSLAHSSTDRPPSAPGRKPATRQMPTAELEIARGGGGGGGGGGGVRTAAALPDSAAVSAAVQAAVQAGYEHGIKEASFSKQRQSLTRQEAPQEDSDDSDDAPVDRGLHSRLKSVILKMSPTTSPASGREYSSVLEQNIDQQRGYGTSPDRPRDHASFDRGSPEQRSANASFDRGSPERRSRSERYSGSPERHSANASFDRGSPERRRSSERHERRISEGMALPAALSSLTPPPLPTLAGRKKFGWTSPCQTSPCAAQSPHAVLHASHSLGASPPSLRASYTLPYSCGAEPSAGCPAAAAADSSAGPTQETIAIASAIAAALATLDGIGGSAQHDDRISQALRYIAENPAIALSSPPALHQ